MSFYISKQGFKFYLLFFTLILTVFIFANYNSSNKAYTSVETFDREQRVIKCELHLKKDLVQNLYYVAPNLQEAKKQLFNAKNGLMFDNELYVKTVDFNGQAYVVKFSDVYCDPVGRQVEFI